MIRTIIESVFAVWLKQNGFVLIEYVHDNEAFGNEYLIYKSEKLFLRFVDDRGDVFIDIASIENPSEWFLLDNLLELIGYKPVRSEAGPETQIKRYCEALNNNIQHLNSLLDLSNISNTRMKMDELDKLKQKQLFPEDQRNNKK